MKRAFRKRDSGGGTAAKGRRNSQSAQNANAERIKVSQVRVKSPNMIACLPAKGVWEPLLAIDPVRTSAGESGKIGNFGTPALVSV